ncbi:hypothetical protein D3C81_882430 [compost metagenome]
MICGSSSQVSVSQGANRRPMALYSITTTPAISSDTTTRATANASCCCGYWP